MNNDRRRQKNVCECCMTCRRELMTLARDEVRRDLVEHAGNKCGFKKADGQPMTHFREVKTEPQRMIDAGETGKQWCVKSHATTFGGRNGK